MKRVSSGASNDIFELHRGGEVLMLRRPPKVGREKSDEIMTREARCWPPSTAPTCPTPLRAPSIRRQLLRDGKVEGFTPMGELPPPFGEDPEIRRQMGFALIEGIALLANVDWRARAGGLRQARGVPRAPGRALALAREGYQRLDGYDGRELAGLEEVAAG